MQMMTLNEFTGSLEILISQQILCFCQPFAQGGCLIAGVPVEKVMSTSNIHANKGHR